MVISVERRCFEAHVTDMEHNVARPETSTPQKKEAGMRPVAGSGSALARFAPFILLACGFTAAYAFGLGDYLSLTYLADRQQDLQSFVASHRLAASAGFFMAYVLAVALSLPAASVLTVAGGFLFGWLQGGTMIVAAATLGATILFLAARTGFGNFLRDRIGARATALAAGFEKDAFGFLLVLRLAPIFPFFLVNIAPAFFKVKTRDYVLATALGILPGTFAYAWLGEGVGSVLEAARASGKTPSVAQLVTPEITIAFTALAVVAAIPLALKRLRTPD